MTTETQGAVMITQDQMNSILKCRTPSIGWLATVVSLILAVGGIVAAAITFVNTSSEKESTTAAESVKAPIYEKMDSLERSTSQSIESLRSSTSREVSSILEAVKASQDTMKLSLDQISRDVDTIARDQKDIVTKLHALEVRQAILDEELKKPDSRPALNP